MPTGIVATIWIRSALRANWGLAQGIGLAGGDSTIGGRNVPTSVSNRENSERKFGPSACNCSPRAESSQIGCCPKTRKISVKFPKFSAEYARQ
jgi:hypothetical protein